MTKPPHRDTDPEAEPKIVVRDRRRVDPVTGALRPPADAPAARGTATPGKGGATTGGASAPEAAPASGPELDKLQSELEKIRGELTERTADLQRITAEYANHRKRVERDRERMAEQATSLALSNLLPVLDDIERARSHGDLTGGFATVAEHLLTAVNKMGLVSFGNEGDVFDPTWHEAVSHAGTADVPEPTCVQVLRKGYSVGEKMLRPALVIVADPAEPGAEKATEETPKPDSDSEL
ncbi:MAG: nucleotide exchange factor GrpE [Corynebacteriales bacterium]|nr:nucleotide exchange factor GrpE [Mycobacteriales bacterium]